MKNNQVLNDGIGDFIKNQTKSYFYNRFPNALEQERVQHKAKMQFISQFKQAFNAALSSGIINQNKVLKEHYDSFEEFDILIESAILEDNGDNNAGVSIAEWIVDFMSAKLTPYSIVGDDITVIISKIARQFESEYQQTKKISMPLIERLFNTVWTVAIKQPRDERTGKIIDPRDYSRKTTGTAGVPGEITIPGTNTTDKLKREVVWKKADGTAIDPELTDILDRLDSGELQWNSLSTDDQNRIKKDIFG